MSAATDRPPVVEDRAEGAIGTAYSLLARLFEEPDEQLFRALQSGDVEAQLATLTGIAGVESAVEVPQLRPADDHDLLCARFNDLFEVGYPDPPVPCYESAYRAEGRWESINVDLARAYEYFDLAIDDTRREHHDHLTLELEFAGYLARLAALDGGRSPRRARRDFLDRHLVPFAADLASAIEEEPSPGIYDDLVHFLEAFVRADVASLDATLDDEAEVLGS